jgi:hypothetical protein
MSVGKSISAIFAWATHAWAEEPRRRPEDLALDLFDTLIVQGNPTLESLERTARARGWAKLTAQETTKLVRPLGSAFRRTCAHGALNVA